MKKTITAILMLLCIAAGGANWLDLVKFTDLSTGFALVGSYWLRYALVGGLLVLILLGALMQPRQAKPAPHCAPAQGLFCLLSGIAFAVLGGLELAPFTHHTTAEAALTYLKEQTLIDKAQVILYLVTAFWFFLLAYCRLSSREEPPTAAAWPGVLGSLSLYLLTIRRFCLSPTGPVRVHSILTAMAALAALLYVAAQAKEIYLQDQKGVRWLYWSGLACFLFCTCLALPGALVQYQANRLPMSGLAEAAALAFVGLCGLCTAFAQAGREKAESQPEVKEAAPQAETEE